MKKKLLFFIITCLLSISCVAQYGSLNLTQDPRIDNLIMKQRQIHVNDSTIDGFRVQIFMELGNDALIHADSVKTRFQEQYPEVPIYLVFGQPYYRLRIGDFRTRLEAENMYQQVKDEYRNAFVTADRIELPYVALCSKVEKFDTIDPEALRKKVFIDDEYVIDTLLLDSLYIHDSLNRLNEEIFYEE